MLLSIQRSCIHNLSFVLVFKFELEAGVFEDSMLSDVLRFEIFVFEIVEFDAKLL